MKLVTKRIKVIEMTEEEIRKFHELMDKAAQGHTSHYAEEKLSDGSFLGVSVVKAHEPIRFPKGKTRNDDLPRSI